MDIKRDNVCKVLGARSEHLNSSFITCLSHFTGCFSLIPLAQGFPRYLMHWLRGLGVQEVGIISPFYEGGDGSEVSW